jgi:hypothetical protein
MFLPELDERFAGDDVHGLLISQIEMFGKGEILLMNELPDFPHHRGQIPHNLIIPKADHLSPNADKIFSRLSSSSLTHLVSTDI